MALSVWDSVKIRNMTTNNRLVMPPMSTRLSNPDGSVTENLIRYYEARAKGGTGLIIIEYSFIDDAASKAAVCQLGVHNDDLIPGLGELTDRLHYYGTKVFLQLCHGGGQSPSQLIKRQPLAPSAIPSKSGEIPTELTISEIAGIVESFGNAAFRAQRAGFDGVEIHGAHGYLVNQFLSALYNKRTDAYGPDFKARSRLPLEIVKDIRERVGDDYPIGFRLNIRDYVPGGIDTDESIDFIKMLEANSVDYIHASAGTYLSHQYMISPIYLPRGHLEDLAKQCKSAVKIPVIAVGGIDHATATRIISDKSADMVALGRALIADPELPHKLRANKEDDIRPCIRCNDGCIGRFFQGKTMRCATNPSAGREAFFCKEAAGTPKKIVVVGGGVAGMEAARQARQRGHQVTVYEKADRLGGNVNVAAIPEGKTDLSDLIKWYEGQLKKLGIDVRLNTEVSTELLEKDSPDAVIIAIGAKQAVPPIEGIDNGDVVTAIDVLTGSKKTEEHVVIIGAGLVGVETALHLSKSPGKKITVLEALETALQDVVNVNILALKDKLKNTDIEIITSANVVEINADKVIYLDRQSKRKSIQADTVILAAGFVPQNRIGALTNGLTAEVYSVGDCQRPGKIIDAVDLAAVVASRL